MSRRMTFGLGITGALGSLAIFTTLFDPYAAIKTFLIINIALLLWGYSLIELIKHRFGALSKVSQYLVYSTVLFVSLFIIRALTSPDINLGLHGVVARNSGALTYLGYGILFILAISFVTLKDFRVVLRSLQIAGLIAGIYSLLEFLNLEPWKMSSVYNATSSLLGNPNFSGAFLSITSILSLWFIVHNKTVREFAISGPTFSLSLFGVYTSKALQGLISIALGFSILLLVWIWSKNKALGRLGLILGSLLAITGVFGSLQIGPFSKFLYKESVSERGDMWRTAISMIKQHPLWGIGIERYGVEFRQYRDLKQALRAGPDVFSDNAHNVFLHLTSTGGIFLGGIYAAITIVVLIVGFKGLLKSSGEKKKLLTVALALWIPIQAQNLISVDNAGVFVWSWILGGSIVALSQEATPIEVVKKKAQLKTLNHPLSPVFGLIFLIVGILLTVNPMIAQKNFSFAFYLGVDAQEPSSLKNKVDYLINAENKDPGNVTWPRYSANSLYIDKAWDATIAAASRAVSKDPEDWVSWWFMASAFESSGRLKEAIPARLKTVELDPLNTSVLLALAKDQKVAGDESGFSVSKSKILSISPNGADAQAVSKL